MKRKGFYLISVLLLSLSFMTSCSNDDEENGGGDFVVNGKGYVTSSEQCSNGTRIEDPYVDIEASFSVLLTNLPDTYNFVIRLSGIYDLSKIKVNDDLIDIAWIRSYNDITNVTPKDDFDENLSGNLIVKAMSNESITLEFIDFTFVELKGKGYTETHVMNGTITYYRLHN